MAAAQAEMAAQAEAAPPKKDDPQEGRAGQEALARRYGVDDRE